MSRPIRSEARLVLFEAGSYLCLLVTLLPFWMNLPKIFTTIAVIVVLVLFWVQIGFFKDNWKKLKKSKKWRYGLAFVALWPVLGAEAYGFCVGLFLAFSRHGR